MNNPGRLSELEKLQDVAINIADRATLYVVGGWVRDMMLGIQSNDVDLVIESACSDDELVLLLNQFGEIVVTDSGLMAGKDFGVFRWLFNGKVYEIARTRKEKGNGASTDTVVNTNDVSIEQDLRRRDVTINAISIRLADMVIVDPLDGQQHIKDKYLCKCSWDFADSIERPLRLAVLMSKLGPEWYVSYELVQMSKNMADWAGPALTHTQAKTYGLHAIPKDQLWAQFSKAMKNPYPSQFLRVMRYTWWLTLFPWLQALSGCEQSPEHHPEGDVFEHVCLVMDEAAQIARRDGFNKEDTMLLVLSALCHDLGKPRTLEVIKVGDEIKITARKHDVVGVEVTTEFLNFIGCPKDIIKKIQKLVEHHMFATTRKEQRVDKVARWLLHTFNNDIKLIKALVEADQSGRSPLPKGFDERTQQILDAVGQIGEFKPIVDGKFLNGVGYFATKQNGKRFGQVIQSCLNAQINGKIKNEKDAIRHLTSMNVIKV